MPGSRSRRVEAKLYRAVRAHLEGNLVGCDPEREASGLTQVESIFAADNYSVLKGVADGINKCLARRVRFMKPMRVWDAPTFVLHGGSSWPRRCCNKTNSRHRIHVTKAAINALASTEQFLPSARRLYEIQARAAPSSYVDFPPGSECQPCTCPTERPSVHVRLALLGIWDVKTRDPRHSLVVVRASLGSESTFYSTPRDLGPWAQTPTSEPWQAINESLLLHEGQPVDLLADDGRNGRRRFRGLRRDRDMSLSTHFLYKRHKAEALPLTVDFPFCPAGILWEQMVVDIFTFPDLNRAWWFIEADRRVGIVRPDVLARKRISLVEADLVVDEKQKHLRSARRWKHVNGIGIGEPPTDDLVSVMADLEEVQQPSDMPRRDEAEEVEDLQFEEAEIHGDAAVNLNLTRIGRCDDLGCKKGGGGPLASWGNVPTSPGNRLSSPPRSAARREQTTWRLVGEIMTNSVFASVRQRISLGFDDGGVLGVGSTEFNKLSHCGRVIIPLSWVRPERGHRSAKMQFKLSLIDPLFFPGEDASRPGATAKHLAPDCSNPVYGTSELCASAGVLTLELRVTVRGGSRTEVLAAGATQMPSFTWAAPLFPDPGAGKRGGDRLSVQIRKVPRWIRDFCWFGDRGLGLLRGRRPPLYHRDADWETVTETEKKFWCEYVTSDTLRQRYWAGRRRRRYLEGRGDFLVRFQCLIFWLGLGVVLLGNYSGVIMSWGAIFLYYASGPDVSMSALSKAVPKPPLYVKGELPDAYGPCPGGRAAYLYNPFALGMEGVKSATGDMVERYGFHPGGAVPQGQNGFLREESGGYVLTSNASEDCQVMNAHHMLQSGVALIEAIGFLLNTIADRLERIRYIFNFSDPILSLILFVRCFGLLIQFCLMLWLTNNFVIRLWRVAFLSAVGFLVMTDPLVAAATILATARRKALMILASHDASTCAHLIAQDLWDIHLAPLTNGNGYIDLPEVSVSRKASRTHLDVTAATLEFLGQRSTFLPRELHLRLLKARRDMCAVLVGSVLSGCEATVALLTWIVPYGLIIFWRLPTAAPVRWLLAALVDQMELIYAAWLRVPSVLEQEHRIQCLMSVKTYSQMR